MICTLWLIGKSGSPHEIPVADVVSKLEHGRSHGIRVIPAHHGATDGTSYDANQAAANHAHQLADGANAEETAAVTAVHAANDRTSASCCRGAQNSAGQRAKRPAPETASISITFNSRIWFFL
jgi:hypothetical protein